MKILVNHPVMVLGSALLAAAAAYLGFVLGSHRTAMPTAGRFSSTTKHPLHRGIGEGQAAMAARQIQG